MANVYQQLERLDLLVKRLVNKYESAIAESEALRKMLLKLENEFSQKSEECGFLEMEIKNIKIARGISQSGEHTKVAKAQISTLVREINHCIALLNE